MRPFRRLARRLVFLLAALCVCEGTSLSQTTFERTYSPGGGSSVQQTSDGGYIVAGSTSSLGHGKSDVYLIKTNTAGDTLWTRTYGGPGDDYGSAVQVTSDGGYIIAGILAYDPGPARGAIYLIKTNSTGDTLWTSTFGATADDPSVQQTSDDGYIVTGYTFHIQAGYSSSTLTKTSSTGTVLWVKAFQIPPGQNESFGHAHSVRQTSEGDYIIAGDCRSSVFLLKTDSSGDTLWIKYFMGSYDEAHAVRQTLDKGYVIVGNTWPYASSGAHIFLVRTNPRGDTLWTRTYASPAYRHAYSVQQTSDGGFVVAGSTTDLGPFAGGENVYLLRTNSAGDTLWTRTYGGPLSNAGHSVQETADGGFIITGGTSSFSFDSQSRVYMIKTDANGLVITPGNFEAFFSSRSDLSIGSFPWSTTAADLDGDGKVDLAASVYDENVVALFRNIGSAGSLSPGSFAGRVTFPSGTGPTGIVSADFDSDGKLDLAVSNAMSGSVSILRNVSVLGTLQLAARFDIPVGKDPKGLAVGDLDGDGKQDLVIPNEGDSSITILQNMSSAGSIAFSSLPAVRVGGGPLKAVIADLDQDRRADIAVVNNLSSSISLLRNQSTPGTISFSSPFTVATSSSPGRMALADIDADGLLDLVVDNINDGTLSLFHNTSTPGSFSFSSPVNFAAGKQPWCVATCDFNGDGRTDVAITNYTDSTVTIFMNRSEVGVIASNSLQYVGTLRTGANPLDVGAGDLDGDGAPDLIVASRGSNTLSLFRNKWNTLALPAAIGLIAPVDSATVGKDSVQLVWTPASVPVDRYELWVGTDPYFWSWNIVIQIGLTGTSTVLHNLTGGRTYWWKVAAENASGTGPYSPSRCFTTLLSDIGETEDIPHEFSLSQNYPNPFNPKTGVRFQVPALSGVEGPGVSDVKITVYDALGRKVAVLVNERKKPGRYEVAFDASGLSSGIYICRMTAGMYSKSMKMLLVK